MFANIAIGGISRPSIVHPSFQCVVHVQANQLDELPAPFLNRFEKYQMSVDDILSWQLARLPIGMNGILSDSLSQCEEFLSRMGDGSIWSLSPNDTLKSLFISMIPPTHLNQSNNEQISGGQLIAAHVLNFLKNWLVLDTSIGDIEQSVVIALSELRGKEGIELRKVVEREECLEHKELEKSFLDLASGAQLQSPLSRSLKKIVHVSITRYVAFRLLQVATPEAVYLQR